MQPHGPLSNRSAICLIIKSQMSRKIAVLSTNNKLAIRSNHLSIKQRTYRLFARERTRPGRLSPDSALKLGRWENSQLQKDSQVVPHDPLFYELVLFKAKE